MIVSRRCRRGRVDRGRGDRRPIYRVESAIRFGTIPAPGVVEQMPDGDLLPPRIDGRSRCRGEVRNEWRNAIVELELAFLDELHDGGAGDRLGHAGDPEQRVRLHRRLVLDIRVTKAARVDQLAIAHHGNRATGDARTSA